MNLLNMNYSFYYKEGVGWYGWEDEKQFSIKDPSPSYVFNESATSKLQIELCAQTLCQTISQ